MAASDNIIERFFWSGVGLMGKGGFALVAFLLLVQKADETQLATYGVVFFFWSMIYVTAQNFSVQPLIESQVNSSEDYGSASINVCLVAFLLAGSIYILAPSFVIFFPALPDLDLYFEYLLIIAPLSTLGLAEFIKKQRDGEFRFIAIYQFIAVFISALIGYVVSMIDVVVGLLLIQALVYPSLLLLCKIFDSKTVFTYKIRLRSTTSRIGKHLALEGNLGVFATQGPLLIIPMMVSVVDAAAFVVIARIFNLVFSQLNRVVSLVMLPLISQIKNDGGDVSRLFIGSNKVLFGLLTIPILVGALLVEKIPSYLGISELPVAVFIVKCLIVKQLLDQVSMLVAVTFRATGRPSWGWQWNLYFSLGWFFMLLAGFFRPLSIEILTIYIVLISSVSFLGIFKICQHLEVSPAKFYKKMLPQYSCSGGLCYFAISYGGTFSSGTGTVVFAFFILLGLFIFNYWFSKDAFRELISSRNFRFENNAKN